MRLFALLLVFGAPTFAAADWVALSGDEIRAALEGRALVYKNAEQDFRASGKTLYQTNGQDSWGNWRIQGDQYCSQWPPSDLWACYGFEQNGAAVRFVGAHNEITEAVYAD